MSFRDAFGSISVVVPAYNAAAYVGSTVDAINEYLLAADVDHEIIVVDDGSTDDTAAIAADRRCRLVCNERNRGKGFSVRRGMLEATLGWRLFLDVDHSTTIDHLDAFAEHTADADVMIASRRLDDSDIVRRQSALRRLAGNTFPYLVRLIALPGISDTQCGFKLFRAVAAERIFAAQRIERFAFDVELLLLARRYGQRIVEVPVRWDNPPQSTVHVSLDALQMFGDVVSSALRHRWRG